MAEINAKDLTAKTSPASTDSMLLFGTTSNEGAKITVDNLADNILSRLTTKTFANQVGGSSAATILAQLATLNSNKPSISHGSFIQRIKETPYTFVKNTGDATYGVVLVFGLLGGFGSVAAIGQISGTTIIWSSLIADRTTGDLSGSYDSTTKTVTITQTDNSAYSTLFVFAF